MNNNLFRSAQPGKMVPKADAKNAAGGLAYKTSDEHALAQIAVTGMFGNTFYAKAETQLDAITEYANLVSPEFLAKCAVYARKVGFMRDTSVVLLAFLLSRDTKLFCKAFTQIIDNGGQLRKLITVLRSGVTGRKTISTTARAMIKKWLSNVTERKLVNALGNSPTMGDVVRLVRPNPTMLAPDVAAMVKWHLGKDLTVVETQSLSEDMQRYLALQQTINQANNSDTTFRLKDDLVLPKVPFQLLEGLPLSKAHMRQMGLQMTPVQMLASLDKFNRNGLFINDVEQCGDDFANAIAQAIGGYDFAKNPLKVMPYRVMTAYLENATTDIGTAPLPTVIRRAIEKALISCFQSVPALPGKTVIALDISGSMSHHISTNKDGTPSKTRCIDVAALFAAILVKQNPEAFVLGFTVDAYKLPVNPDDSLLTIASNLADCLQQQGTDTGIVVGALNQNNHTTDNIVIISDNEGWVGNTDFRHRNSGSHLQAQWNQYLVKHPKARMMCVNVSPEDNNQCTETSQTINVGGFNDSVFELMERFFNGNHGVDTWMRAINEIEL